MCPGWQSKKHVGWVVFPGGRRAHYVKKSVSLCGAWSYWGRMFNSVQSRGMGKCRACEAALEKYVQEKVVDPSVEEWLGEFDWRQKGERNGGR
jgi:hypothetical protein